MRSTARCGAGAAPPTTAPRGGASRQLASTVPTAPHRVKPDVVADRAASRVRRPLVPTMMEGHRAREPVGRRPTRRVRQVRQRRRQPQLAPLLVGVDPNGLVPPTACQPPHRRSGTTARPASAPADAPSVSIGVPVSTAAVKAGYEAWPGGGHHGIPTPAPRAQPLLDLGQLGLQVLQAALLVENRSFCSCARVALSDSALPGGPHRHRQVLSIRPARAPQSRPCVQQVLMARCHWSLEVLVIAPAQRLDERAVRARLRLLSGPRSLGRGALPRPARSWPARRPSSSPTTQKHLPRPQAESRSRVRTLAPDGGAKKDRVRLIQLMFLLWIDPTRPVFDIAACLSWSPRYLLPLTDASAIARKPFAINDLSGLTAGILVAVFMDWGWDSTVTVNGETEDSSRTPRIAAILSIIVLVGIWNLAVVLGRRPGVRRPRVPGRELRRRAGHPRHRRARVPAPTSCWSSPC